MKNDNQTAETWKYVCRSCDHITFFIVGGAQDVICHRCWSYDVRYEGRVDIDIETIRNSQRGK